MRIWADSTDKFRHAKLFGFRLAMKREALNMFRAVKIESVGIEVENKDTKS